MGRPKKEPVICSFEACESHQVARKLCAKHYARWLRYGDPSIVLPTGVAAGVKSPLHQKCKINGCLQLGPYIKGLCGSHYGRLKAHGDPLAGRPRTGTITTRSTVEPCKSEGCENSAIAKGFCSGHWGRFKKFGDPQSHIPLRKITVGGKAYVHNGYVSRWDAKEKKVVFDHRSVMSQYLGRPLRKNESVHHKNGDRADNRLKNLELWVTSQPTGQRPIDLLKWAREIIKTYVPDETKLKKLEYRNQ